MDFNVIHRDRAQNSLRSGRRVCVAQPVEQYAAKDYRMTVSAVASATPHTSLMTRVQ